MKISKELTYMSNKRKIITKIVTGTVIEKRNNNKTIKNFSTETNTTKHSSRPKPISTGKKGD